MWRLVRKKRRRRRASSVTKHYVDHKEQARELVLARLQHFNQHYGLEWNRVAIRNQRRCWGSCTSLKNLNFNYKILLLPPHLRDYIIVHELCHLKHLHHGKDFWNLVAEQMPEYKKHVAELRAIDKLGHSVQVLTKVQDHYLSCAREQAKQSFDVEPNHQPSIESCVRNAV
jgi:predicted metal-dependent hydrolase